MYFIKPNKNWTQNTNETLLVTDVERIKLNNRDDAIK